MLYMSVPFDILKAHLVDLKRMEYSGSFPEALDGTCISALAFNASETLLAAATVGGGLTVYQVAGRTVAPWHTANSVTLRQRLAAVPGAICELSFSPDPKVRPAGPSVAPMQDLLFVLGGALPFAFSVSSHGSNCRRTCC